MLDSAQDNRRLRVVMADLTPLAWDAGVLTLRVVPTARLAAESLRAELTSLAQARAGRTLELRFDVPVAPSEPAGPAFVAAEHPLVKHAMELFGAKVVAVQPRKVSKE